MLILAAVAAACLASGPVAGLPAFGPAFGDNTAACRPGTPLVRVADEAAPLPAVDETSPARDMPMNPLELTEFLETVVRAQALDRFCEDLFSRDQKAAIYLSYRWGKSVATTDTYPASLFLNTISTKAEYMRLMKDQDCSDPRLQRTRGEYDAFLRGTLPKIRMSEIR